MRLSQCRRPLTLRGSRVHVGDGAMGHVVWLPGEPALALAHWTDLIAVVAHAHASLVVHAARAQPAAPLPDPLPFASASPLPFAAAAPRSVPRVAAPAGAVAGVRGQRGMYHGRIGHNGHDHAVSLKELGKGYLPDWQVADGAMPVAWASLLLLRAEADLLCFPCRREWAVPGVPQALWASPAASVSGWTAS